MADVARIMPEVRAIQVPAPLRELPGWCLWRYEQFEGEAKPRKIPYYHSGARRRGRQGSPEDRDQLTSFVVAREAAARRGFDGVGLALLPEWGIVALDFDRVVAPDGSLPPLVEQLAATTYAEYSPSGLGIRAFVRGDLGNHKSASAPGEDWGVETFSSSGFVTITGNILEGVDLIGHQDTIAPVSEDVRALCQRRFGATTSQAVVDDFMAGFEPPLGLSGREVHELLDVLDPDCGREDWVRVGMALHHEFGASEEGFQFWDDWSSLGGKYPGDDALRSQWESFTRRMGPGRKQVTMASVMKMVKDARAAEAATIAGVEAQAEKLVAGLPVAEGTRTPEGFAGRFPITAASDMVASTTSSWLIKNVLPMADLGALYGASGSGKSFVSLDLAIHIARGEPWRGHRVKQGTVVIITAEGGGSYGKRIKAYCQHHGISADDLPLGIINAQPNILEADDIGELTASLKAIGPVSLLIIDTLAQVTPGANENTSEDMGRAITNAQILRKATGAMILLIHHAGKDASKGARGWSGLKGALDVEIEVSRDEETNAREIRLTKMKDEEDGLRFGFSLEIVTVGMDSDGDEMRSCVAIEAEVADKRKAPEGREPAALTEYDKAIREVLDDYPSETRFHLPRLVEEVMRRLPAGGERDVRRQQVQRSLRRYGRTTGMDAEVRGGALIFYE